MAQIQSHRFARRQTDRFRARLRLAVVASGVSTLAIATTWWFAMGTSPALLMVSMAGCMGVNAVALAFGLRAISRLA